MKVLQGLGHLHGPHQDSAPQVYIILMLRTPELDAALQAGHSALLQGQSRGEKYPPSPWPAVHDAFGAAWDVAGLLRCEHTLLAHVQLFIK